MSVFRKIFTNHDILENTVSSNSIKSIIENLGINKNNEKSFINGLLGNSDEAFPASLMANDKITGGAIVDQFQKRYGLNMTDEQRGQAIKLIQSGDLFHDVGDAMLVIIKFAGSSDNFQLPKIDDLIKDLPLASKEDLQILLVELNKIHQGEETDSPELLNNTMFKIYSTPQIGNAIEAANLLFDKNNKSLRLALIIYAKLHNVNLEEADIDVVRELMLNRNKPDLGGLIFYVNKNKERLAVK